MHTKTEDIGTARNALKTLKYVALAGFTAGPIFYYQTLDSYDKRQVDVNVSAFGRFLRLEIKCII